MRKRLVLAPAAGFFVLLAALILITPTGAHAPVGRALALACAAVQAAAIAPMRRHPELSMATAILAGVGIELLSPDIGWLGQVAAVLACYARLRPPARSLWVLGLLIAGTPWKLVHGDWTNLLLAAAGPALGWTLGELGRTRARPGPQGARRDRPGGPVHAGRAADPVADDELGGGRSDPRHAAAGARRAVHLGRVAAGHRLAGRSGCRY